MLALVCTLFVLQAHAETHTQTLTASCNTNPTGLDGVRHDCTSSTSTINAADGYAFIQNDVAGGEVSGVGDKHECRLAWDNFVEIIPGSKIKLPRKASLSCYALGPSGRAAGGG